MPGSVNAGPLGNEVEAAARTPGALGRSDAASPDSPMTLTGDTPGALGRYDWGDPDHPAYGFRILFPPTQNWTTPGGPTYGLPMPFLTPLTLDPGKLSWPGLLNPSPWAPEQGSVTASTPGTAGDPSGGMLSVIRALDEKRLQANMNDVRGQLRAIANDGMWTDPKGNVLKASPELINLLAGLVDNGATMTIMSLFRFKNGPHGEPQADGTAIGRAIDIMGYGGFDIHLKKPANKDNAIAGVCAVISHLPAGKYALGLPRPGGGPLIDPPNDVFLPVTDHSQVVHSPGGSLKKDLEFLLEPAKTAVKAAVAGNPGAKIQFMFPDGVDHIHVKAVA
jgi:hypothetical protein